MIPAPGHDRSHAGALALQLPLQPDPQGRQHRQCLWRWFADTLNPRLSGKAIFAE
jgi:hypothetical protein